MACLHSIGVQKESQAVENKRMPLQNIIMRQKKHKFLGKIQVLNIRTFAEQKHWIQQEKAEIAQQQENLINRLDD